MTTDIKPIDDSSSRILNQDEQFSFKNEERSNNDPSNHLQDQSDQSSGNNKLLLRLESHLEKDITQMNKENSITQNQPQVKNPSTAKNFDQMDKIRKFFTKQYKPIFFNAKQMKQLNSKQGTTVNSAIQLKKYNKDIYYLGQFNSQGMKHGIGMLIYFTNVTSDKVQYNRVYQGGWSNDKRSGKGSETFSDGSLYKGDYLQNKPNGNGKFVNPDGEVYEGEWNSGVKQGKGFWKGTDGSTYLGEWVLGHPEGYGVFVNQKGDRYEGEFNNFLKHGEGIEKFRNGDIYKGFYQNGKPGGPGQYYWANKSFFKGHFKNGLRCGQGLWKRGPGNCDRYQGQYQNDKKWGWGIFTWANGNMYKGNYLSDLRNGYGQMYWNNGSYYKGEWKQGVQDGQGQLYIAGQGLRKGKFANNEIVRISFQQVSYVYKDDDEEDRQNQENHHYQSPNGNHNKKSNPVLKNNLKKTVNNRSIAQKHTTSKSLNNNKSALSNLKRVSSIKNKLSKRLMKPVNTANLVSAYNSLFSQKTKVQRVIKKPAAAKSTQQKQLQQLQTNYYKINNPKQQSKKLKSRVSVQASRKILQASPSRQQVHSKPKSTKHSQRYQNRQSQMKSVPLKKIIQQQQTQNNDRYQATSIAKNNPFRIQVRTSTNYVNGNSTKNDFAKDSSSFDSYSMRKSTDNFPKKDRLLHSSFYLHRFRNIGKPSHNNVLTESQPQVNANDNQ